jgi:hypothetical protein
MTKKSDLDRVKSIVARGSRTRRTPGGWDLRNIRFAKYPSGGWVIASLDRSGDDKPVVWAKDREICHKMFDMIMDEMEAKVA